MNDTKAHQDESKRFVLPVRVYYEDTDAGGVVFYANYLKFFERGRTEWLRNLGVNQAQLAEEQQRIFVVVGTQLRYRSPARLDDLLQINTTLSKVGNSSCSFEQIAERNGEILVESSIQICCVDTQSFKPAPIPADIRSLFLSVQDN
ncbi:Acyl-CoA thioesterase YbgC [Oligella urethralis]|uniref:tol-pal system-associated acyl-CoA thioesterase n=1 Tax=Oligella TaxID=90243 RepID=UPI0008A410A0|nr:MULTISPECIES: tol-pal system-associated acyl-CoA thioesterase [Oligella]OFV46252.1 Tol-Pal system-associated acyl-CoA thioesterase [Oligella sp. HMSC09E12]WOS36598.1 Acyl-CoA thioesterase YbgC [Oligella urethralis]SUA57097.1 Acyl-CoA thioester hydrolase YbgC [Oligella urethralis]